MNEITNNLKQLKPADKIASANTLLAVLTVLMTIFTGSITYFGYSLNQQAEKRNQQEWVIQQAKYRNSFWKEISEVEKGIIEQTSVIGSNIGVFIVASVETLNEMDRLHQAGKSLKLEPENIKLQAAFAGLVSAYAKLQSSIEEIAVNYDSSILIYSPLVNVLDVKGWEAYLEQTNNLNEWKSSLIKDYRNTYNLMHAVTKEGEPSVDFERKIQDYGFKMGYSLKNLSPPSLSGLMELKELNHPMHNE